MEQVRWANEELKTLDKMTRKVLTMNGAFHSKRDVDRLYVSREDGGRADSLWWYVKNSWNVLLQGLRGKVY